MAKKKKEVSVSESEKIALDFSTKVYKKFKEIIKSIVLFGGVAKEKISKKSDVDLMIIIDDCTIQWDQELIAWYREELAKLLNAQPYKKKIHLNTVTLTTYWEEVKAGEPVAINALRYGKALIDFGGYFEPLKVLLARGRIRPTPEAVLTNLRRAPLHIAKTRFSIVSAVEGLYWAMVDSAHAALMAANQVPPSPEHISILLNDIFVKHNELDKKYVQTYEEMRKLVKEITHGNIKHIKGREVDNHIKIVEEFVQEMTDLTEKLLKGEKIIRVKKK